MYQSLFFAVTSLVSFYRSHSTFVSSRALLQTQVPRPPVKTTRKISPVRADRKSLGGQAQTRPRRYTNVGIAASTDKPPKRTISLGGNSNPDSELSGM